MKSEIISPMPPSHAHPWSAVQVTPSGSAASRRRTAAIAAPVIPSGFPIASPRMTASVTLPPVDPLRLTPAFESANSGMTTKAQNHQQSAHVIDDGERGQEDLESSGGT